MDKRQPNLQSDGPIPPDYVPDITSIDNDKPQATSDQSSDNLGTPVRDVYGQIDHIPLPARTTMSGRAFWSLLKQTIHVCAEGDNDQPNSNVCAKVYDQGFKYSQLWRQRYWQPQLMPHLSAPPLPNVHRFLGRIPNLNWI